MSGDDLELRCSFRVGPGPYLHPGGGPVPARTRLEVGEPSGRVRVISIEVESCDETVGVSC